MDIDKIIGFFRSNSHLIIVLVVVLAPSIWGMAHLFYSNTINSLEAHVDLLDKEVTILKDRVQELEEKKESFKGLLIEQYTEDYSHIYTPSE